MVTAQPGQRADPADDSEPAGLGGALKGWLAAHSHAYVFLRGLAYNLARPAPADPLAALAGELDVLRRPEPAPVTAGWAKATGILDQMQAAARAHGARLVVVVIPTREQVDEAAWGKSS